MTDGLESDLEAAGQRVDVVALRLGGCQELPIGQQKCASEVVGQADPGDLTGPPGGQSPGLVLDVVRTDDGVDHDALDFFGHGGGYLGAV